MERLTGNILISHTKILLNEDGRTIGEFNFSSAKQYSDQENFCHRLTFNQIIKPIKSIGILYLVISIAFLGFM